MMKLTNLGEGLLSMKTLEILYQKTKTEVRNTYIKLFKIFPKFFDLLKVTNINEFFDLVDENNVRYI